MEFEFDTVGDPMKELLNKFRQKVSESCNQLERSAFQQEPNYVAALMGKLAGMVISENGFHIQTTIVNDRGPKSAEKEFGADFAIILATPSGPTKSILGQAKGGDITKLSPSEKLKFDKQCSKILRYSSQFIGLAASTKNNRMPEIWLGSGPPVALGKKLTLVDYLVDEFIACRHGDRGQQFSTAVANSDLLQLRVLIR